MSQFLSESEIEEAAHLAASYIRAEAGFPWHDADFCKFVFHVGEDQGKIDVGILAQVKIHNLLAVGRPDKADMHLRLRPLEKLVLTTKKRVSLISITDMEFLISYLQSSLPIARSYAKEIFALVQSEVELKPSGELITTEALLGAAADFLALGGTALLKIRDFLPNEEEIINYIGPSIAEGLGLPAPNIATSPHMTSEAITRRAKLGALFQTYRLSQLNSGEQVSSP